MRNPLPLFIPDAPDQSWSVDFTHDALACDRCFHTVNIVDDFNLEVFSNEIELNLPSPPGIFVPNMIAANRGYPAMLHMNYGPEFILRALTDWQRSMYYDLNCSNRVSRNKTLSLSALTEHIAEKARFLSVKDVE